MGARLIVGKCELAEALGFSRSYFFRKLHKNIAVLQELEKNGYQKKSRSLTPKQLTIICEYYGYPDCMDKD